MDILTTDVKYIKKTLDELRLDFNCIGKKYVKIERYEPVEKLVYGLVGFILLYVFGSIVSLVILH
jgi:hypothetical protein